MLAAFNEGRVDETLMNQIGAHLDVCEACIDRLENMEPGPIARGLRRSVLGLEEVEDQMQSSGSVLSSDWTKFRPSQHRDLGFERYELIGSIAENPFANLFMALTKNQEAVAIKIPYRAKISSPHHCQLFLRDAEDAATLNHPNILPLIDFGFWLEDLPFVATRHLDAPNLKQFALDSGLDDADRMRQVLGQICQAVGFAHEQGVLHRHLTPNNVFLPSENEVLVADFSVHFDGRYQFELQEPLQDPNPFESPEAVHNNPDFIDHRNDIFAIGKILKLLLRITAKMDDSQRQAFESVQARCTSYRRRDRYQSVQELLQAIESI